MIWRRLPPFCKLVIFWVKLRSMSISSYQLQIPALMTSTIRPTKNDDLEERNRILKNSHLWVVIGLSKDFTVRSPKCCFWWWASQDCLKTMVQRRVTVCCCLAIFWVVRGLSEGLTVGAPKCRADDEHYKPSWKGWFRGVFHHFAN